MEKAMKTTSGRVTRNTLGPEEDPAFELVGRSRRHDVDTNDPGNAGYVFCFSKMQRAKSGGEYGAFINNAEYTEAGKESDFEADHLRRWPDSVVVGRT
jgi:hypothetical protein